MESDAANSRSTATYPAGNDGRRIVRLLLRQVLLLACVLLISLANVTSAETAPRAGEPSTSDTSSIDPSARPFITAAKLQWLLERTAASQKKATAAQNVTHLLGITTGEEVIDLKAITKVVDDVRHTFSRSQRAGRDDILMLRIISTTSTVYLTNSKLILRAACVVDNGQPRLITNEQALSGFQAELKFYNDTIK